MDAAAGVTSDDEAEAAVNRLMARQAKRTVVVADGHKLGRVGVARICEVADVAAVLTDKGAASETVEPSAGLASRSSWRDREHR